MVTLTLDLDQRTIERLRERAAREGITLEALVAAALRQQAGGGEKPSIEAIEGLLDLPERERRLRELDGKYDLGDPDLSLKAGTIMRELFSSQSE